MSLLDALLLEPFPTNVWIAYRTDGVKGSGHRSQRGFRSEFRVSLI